MRVNEWAWKQLPSALTSSRLMLPYGTLLHSLVKMRSVPRQSHGTFFLRNRPELELLTRLAKRRAEGSKLRFAVFGCSNGAEVYSILWAVRSARPNLTIEAQAIDISSEIIRVAQQGRYYDQAPGMLETPIFERLTAHEMRALFEKATDHVKIKPWLKEGVAWLVADAKDPQLMTLIGLQDIVIANRLLCHMGPEDAEQCLRNIARLVRPGGYLFVSGVDLDIRTRVARDLAWVPVRELLEEMHDGDPSLREGWPWQYWGLEPLDRRQRDWVVRYASVFQINQGALIDVGVRAHTH
jgi:2-polyprenyl-3-methyl-5-hydroxy-6-metoxy-1,4-benzoquinol methylase